MEKSGALASWVGANIVPLVLIPLAALFVWVAIWEVWLPRSGSAGGGVTRTITTVDANAGIRPTHKVTKVVRSAAGATPARRSETLVIVLLFLGAGLSVVAVFHDRIGSIELDSNGLKVTLTKAEKDAAGDLVDRLARHGSGPRSYGRALRRYLQAVASVRPPADEAGVKGAGLAAETGLDAAEALAIARRIADDFTL